MRINEMKIEDIKVGLRIKSLVSDKQGTVIAIDYKDDNFSWVQWDNDDQAYGGFYGNACKCEVIA